LSKITGEVIDVLDEDPPFKVSFTFDGKLWKEWSVQSREEGDHFILEVLYGIEGLARKEGYLE
jgi:hypothetical protein